VKRMPRLRSAPNCCGASPINISPYPAPSTGHAGDGSAEFEIARCFAGLAEELTRNDADVKRATWSLFKSV